MTKQMTNSFFRYIFMSLGVIYFILMTGLLAYLMYDNLEIRNLATRSDVYLQKHADGYCDFIDDWEAHNAHLLGENLSPTSTKAKENNNV